MTLSASSSPSEPYSSPKSPYETSIWRNVVAEAEESYNSADDPLVESDLDAPPPSEEGYYRKDGDYYSEESSREMVRLNETDDTQHLITHKLSDSQFALELSKEEVGEWRDRANKVEAMLESRTRECQDLMEVLLTA